MQTTINFVNHASVAVGCGDINILTDPWYSGHAFHKGWNLIYETPEEEVLKLLDMITHIWISHEHPDHFSVKFFITYERQIKKNDIKILFQNTYDKRVLKFLSSKEFTVIELPHNKSYKLSENVDLMCIKDGFYDSGLLITNGSEKILNLNDCEVTNIKRANEVKELVGEVDILLTQFSFAAWKGGKKNKRWRDSAAIEKLETMKLQVDVFKPKAVIPFASFIYFSNKLNYYLNDAANTLADVELFFTNRDFELLLMQPGDVFGGVDQKINNQLAKQFWENQRNSKSEETLNHFESVSESELSEAFQEYCERILSNNNELLMRLIRFVRPIGAFRPVDIFLLDLNVTVSFDYLCRKITFGANDRYSLSMHSESLYFLFKNGFGFDTLTVNGCFEETKNGFVKATKSLAIENLNNLGIQISIKTLFNFSIIKMFFVRLYRVARKLEE